MTGCESLATGVIDTNTARLLDGELPGSLSVHPHQIDLPRDRVLLIRMSPQDYADASFLDQRLLQGVRPRAWFAWEHIQERMGGSVDGTPAHYIFHVGHCGSTLVSRVLGELGLLPLREPLVLRTFAELLADPGSAHGRWDSRVFESRLKLTLRLFARGSFPKAVKASSFCNDLLPAILASNPAVRATIVYAAPRQYVANMMAGSNSRLDLKALMPMRLQRLTARIGSAPAALQEMSPGVAAAVSWASEMAALATGMDRAGESRIRAIDFDAFLADLRGCLQMLAEHAAPGTTDARIDAVSASGTLRRYSKAPEFEYDAALRRSVLADAELRWGTEIRAGLNWLGQAGARFPAVSRALERFGGS